MRSELEQIKFIEARIFIQACSKAAEVSFLKEETKEDLLNAVKTIKERIGE